MANITAKDVATLRERTGVGMMDCKKALVEADGDFEQAIVILREKGLASQAKKAGRVSAEGLVEAFVENGVGVVVEVNSETDFVVNTDQFKAFVKTVAKTIVAENPADVEALKACKAVGSEMTVQEELQELFLKIRENIQIRRFTRLEGDLVSYVHGEGRIGVLVQLDTDLGDKAYACGKDCALQIAAMSPSYLDRASVPAGVLEGEKKIVMAQMAEDPKMANKPEAALAKIAEGKLGKYYTENCLVEQEFVKDGDYTVGKYVEKCAKDLGGKIAVKQFVRYERGEGIAKKEENFAEEIASMIK